MTLVQFIKVNMIQKRLALIIHFLRAKNENFSVLSRAGAAFFCQEPEPTQFGLSRSRLHDLGLPEPKPPKKVAAPQHWS